MRQNQKSSIMCFNKLLRIWDLRFINSQVSRSIVKIFSFTFILNVPINMNLFAMIHENVIRLARSAMEKIGLSVSDPKAFVK